MTRYDIAKQFTAGYCAAVGVTCHRDQSKSDHWLAGWDAGYSERKLKNEKLNAYMVRTGREPFGVVRLCESVQPTKGPSDE